MRNARGRKAARRISISWYGEFGDEIGEATNHSFDWSTVDTRRQLRRKWKSTSKKEHKKTAITVCDLKSCNGQPGSHRCPIYKWRDTLTRRRKKAGGMDQQTRKKLWRFGRERKYKWIIRKSKEQLVQLKERERESCSSSLQVFQFSKSWCTLRWGESTQVWTNLKWTLDTCGRLDDYHHIKHIQSCFLQLYYHAN